MDIGDRAPATARIALNVKGVSYRQEPVNLLDGAQKHDAFLRLNPQGLVPALVAGTTVLTQSSAIVEWLEESYPAPPLLPSDLDERAIVRTMAMAVACDIHPLNNLRVLKVLTSEFEAGDEARERWMGRWIADGFAALEILVQQHGGRYAFGNSLTLADCHIVPQIYAAERFNVPLADYPALVRAARAAQEHHAVAAAHPDRQPDKW